MPQMWEIVGGADKGGILVKKGQSVSAEKEDTRLSTGALVEEVELLSDRLSYRLVTGAGPPAGWITISLPGKDLAVRTDKGPAGGGIPELVVLSECEPPGTLAARVARSKATLRARREGAPVGTDFFEKLSTAQHVARVNPNCFQPVTAFQRMDRKTMYEKVKTNYPGLLTGMDFPWTTEQIQSYGAEWMTKAFHRYKTLPEDNAVKRLVQVKPLPISGFDSAGGSGPKTFVTVEYEKPDPNLHTELFAKMPWDPHGSYPGVPESTPQAYRFMCSSGGGEDTEVFVSAFFEQIFPFPIPKCYFADLSRENTNYIVISERIAFGQRGKLVNGKIEGEPKKEPYGILPVCGKYQDFLLDDAPAIYMQLMRVMAQLAAWDHLGRFDMILGPLNKYTCEQHMESTLPRREKKAKVIEVQQAAATTIMNRGTDFVRRIAPQLFTEKARSLRNCDTILKNMVEAAPYFEDIKVWLGNCSDYAGVQHANLQADNVYLWRDEEGDLDSGVFDFSGLGRRETYVLNFLGCLTGAEADMLDEYEDRLMQCFAAEFERYGGPHLDWEDLRFRYQLAYMMCATDTTQWIERDALRELPEAEWKDIKDRLTPKFQDTWNARCRTTTFIAMMELWPKRDWGKLFRRWKEGVGKPYLTPFTKA